MFEKSNMAQVRKFDPFSVAQAASGPEWESTFALTKHEKIIAFFDAARGDVQIRFHVKKDRKK